MKKYFILIIICFFLFGCSFEKVAKRTTIYFVTNKAMYGVSRNIPAGDNELMVRMKLLKEGPTFVEKSIGVHSSLPVSLNVNDIYIQNNIVFIDVDNSFEQWSASIADITLGLAQIVYSFTEIKNVQSVVFLVEGRKKDLVLSGDGYVINKPLTRNDFNKN